MHDPEWQHLPCALGLFVVVDIGPDVSSSGQPLLSVHAATHIRVSVTTGDVVDYLTPGRGGEPWTPSERVMSAGDHDACVEYARRVNRRLAPA
jgi:hypothetical protein